MTIKDFGARVESVWQGLRPVTKKMLVGALQTNAAKINQKFSYDAHADWELSRLLSALDEQANSTEVKRDAEKLREIKQFSNACAGVLEAQTASAEVFIQLAKRAIARSDYKKLDALADVLMNRFSAGEIAEIIRQTDMAQIRAIAYETLALLPVSALMTILDDSIYTEITVNALEQQAFEYDSEEARDLLEQLNLDEIGD
jgi:hypothetical protein